MARIEIYRKILERALSNIYSELDEAGFDIDSIDINIKLYNNDFDEEFDVE